ncbi:MAG TPA: O-antigen ligase family protein [Actinomycetota bacterium]|nr:O-antigen ligase family protein [Actinomycetota bacterium]
MAVQRGQLRDPQLTARYLVPIAAVILLVALMGGTSPGELIFFAATAAALSYALDAVAGPARISMPARVAQGVITALLLAIPLLVDPEAFALYDIPKFTALVVGTCLTLIVVCLRRLAGGTQLVIRNGLELPIAGLVGALTLATIFASSITTGILGLYASLDGLITTLACAGLLFATVHVFTIADVRRLLKVFFFGATGVILLYGLLQFIDISLGGGWEFIPTKGDLGLSATLSNKNHLSGFLAAMLPVGVALVITARSRWDRMAGLFALAILILELSFNRTTGAFVGAVLGLLVLGWYQRRALVEAWRGVSPTWKWMFAGVAGLLLVAVGVFMLLRLRGVVAEQDASLVRAAGGRLQYWSAALKMAGDDPITGVGPDSFMVHFWSYQTRPFVEAFGPVRGVNGAHNIFFNYLATTGFVGLSAFVALIFFLFLRGTAAIRRLRVIGTQSKEGTEATVLVSASLGAIAGYLGQATFNIQHVELTFVFWMMAALVCLAALDTGVPSSARPREVLRPAVQQEEEDRSKSKKKSRKGGTGTELPVAPIRTIRTSATPAGRAGIWAFCVLCIAVFWFGLRPLRADHAYRDGLGLEDSLGQYENEERVRVLAAAYESFEDAWTLNPWEARYADNAGRVRLRFPIDLREGTFEQSDAAAVEQQFVAAIEWMDKGLEVQPHDALLWASRGEAFFRLSSISDDERHRSEAISSLNRSLELNPWLIDVHQLLVQVYVDADMLDEARDAFATASLYATEEDDLDEIEAELETL